MLGGTPLLELSQAEQSLVVAVHEAGHAVTCVKLGVPFCKVTLGGGPGAIGGAIGPGTVTEPFDGGDEAGSDLSAGTLEAERYRGQAVVCLAGRIAEEAACQAGVTKAVGLNSSMKDERDAKLFVRSAVMVELRERTLAATNRQDSVSLEDLPGRSVQLFAECRLAAGQLVAENFAVIEAVARELARRGELSKEQVTEIVGDGDGRLSA